MLEVEIHRRLGEQPRRPLCRAVVPRRGGVIGCEIRGVAREQTAGPLPLPREVRDVLDGEPQQARGPRFRLPEKDEGTAGEQGESRVVGRFGGKLVETPSGCAEITGGLEVEGGACASERPPCAVVGRSIS